MFEYNFWLQLFFYRIFCSFLCICILNFTQALSITFKFHKLNFPGANFYWEMNNISSELFTNFICFNMFYLILKKRKKLKIKFHLVLLLEEFDLNRQLR